MRVENVASAALAALLGFAAAGCQSSGGAATAAAPAASTAEPGKPAATAYAPPSGASATAGAVAAQCAMRIAGPPPKPAKGADFGKAVGKNLGKNVGRNVLAGLGGAVAGPLGNVVVGAVATDRIRSEQDLKGKWTATDGASDCACPVDISSGVNLQGRTVYKGKLSASACSDPLLARAASWNLGHTFTGYDASFDLLAGDGSKLATLKRDGMDYFSGTLADGKPITLWRE